MHVCANFPVCTPSIMSTLIFYMIYIKFDYNRLCPVYHFLYKLNINNYSVKYSVMCQYIPVLLGLINVFV